LRRHVKTAANFEKHIAVPLPSSGLAIIKHSKKMYSAAAKKKLFQQPLLFLYMYIYVLERTGAVSYKKRHNTK